ncbi:glycosyltransferase family 4 protein [Halomonas saccharevitans]|uniref:Glycosyltransferase family 4 protein n=1 Tax=Halomonas saccharevitans TaxID=416872 RepID=A0ABU3NC81_9GAMM|nr:glycosyltransferase family 4 protein [Halomonas saccharevitans]MDT8878784.1 glycosyltransferase family 4 protein [Halomonas saccharevitans]
MPQESTPDLVLIVAGNPDQKTGGYLYDARMVAELRRQAWRVEVVGLQGRFPLPDRKARHSLATTLAGLADDALVVIDGLAMGGLPDEVERHAERLRIVALVHHPLADETGLDVARKAWFREREAWALAAARRVIVTSHHTARGLSEYGVPDQRIRVAEPGVDRAPLADAALDPEVPASAGRLLCVATLTPRKGLGLLVEALAALTDRAWACEVIGSHRRDPGHAHALLAETRRLGLADRLRFMGEQDDRELEAAYRRAALFVLPSWYEGYGMVVTEALARGLPVITTTGGALADTLPPAAGIAVPPGDVGALREALSGWLDDPGLRHRLRRGAREARNGLADWPAAARDFMAALNAIPEAPIGDAARLEGRGSS